MAANFQRGSTPIAGQQITSRDFGNLANASTAARQSPSSDVFGVQGGGGFVAFPVANRRTPTAPLPRAFFTYGVSAGGANGLISVTAGSVDDLTNSGTVWTGSTGNVITIDDPTNGVTPFAVPVGSPLVYPRLQLDPAATCCYLNATVDATTGFITAMEIDGDSGAGVPASTSTNFYYLLSSLTVVITSGVAVVTPILNDGAQSSLNFAICGLVPLMDGTLYRVGT